MLHKLVPRVFEYFSVRIVRSVRIASGLCCSLTARLQTVGLFRWSGTINLPIHPKSVFCQTGWLSASLICPTHSRSRNISAPRNKLISDGWWNSESARTIPSGICRLQRRIRFIGIFWVILSTTKQSRLAWNPLTLECTTIFAILRVCIARAPTLQICGNLCRPLLET